MSLEQTGKHVVPAWMPLPGTGAFAISGATQALVPAAAGDVATKQVACLSQPYPSLSGSVIMGKPQVAKHLPSL